MLAVFHCVRCGIVKLSRAQFSLWIFFHFHGIHKFNSGDKPTVMLPQKTSWPFPNGGVAPFSVATGLRVSVCVHVKGNFITIGL